MLSKPEMDDQDERHKFLTHEQIFTKHIICAMPFLGSQETTVSERQVI